MVSDVNAAAFEAEVLEPTEANREKKEVCPTRAGSGSCDCSSPGGATEASEPVVEYDRLGGRDARCEEIEGVRLFTTGTSAGAPSDRLLVCDNGRKNDTVLDLRKACLSAFSFSSSSTDFLTSGSLNSSFPFLSDAKYSSPRPKTTWSDAQSLITPSVGFSHSLSAGGRSYPSTTR